MSPAQTETHRDIVQGETGGVAGLRRIEVNTLSYSIGISVLSDAETMRNIPVVVSTITGIARHICLATKDSYACIPGTIVESEPSVASRVVEDDQLQVAFELPGNKTCTQAARKQRQSSS